MNPWHIALLCFVSWIVGLISPKIVLMIREAWALHLLRVEIEEEAEYRRAVDRRLN